MPIAVSPDQKFGFRIEKLAFWVASKWSLDQFCLGFFFLKINSANWFCQNNRGSQGDNEKGMGQGCWGGVGWGGGGGGGSVEHTIKTKVGCFSRNNLGLKGGQEKFYNLSITAIIVWAKSWLRGHI